MTVWKVLYSFILHEINFYRKKFYNFYRRIGLNFIYVDIQYPNRGSMPLDGVLRPLTAM
ncbi:hypothetical protein CKA32_005953 [Geitlerinema sp. FC II]|nr:hypothetical protein CKA32_005953 [Geitlerinema sp. FC II]